MNRIVEGSVGWRERLNDPVEPVDTIALIQAVDSEFILGGEGIRGILTNVIVHRLMRRKYTHIMIASQGASIAAAPSTIGWASMQPVLWNVLGVAGLGVNVNVHGPVRYPGPTPFEYGGTYIGVADHCYVLPSGVLLDGEYVL